MRLQGPQYRRARHAAGVAATVLVLAIASGCARTTPTHKLRMVPVDTGPALSLSEVRLSPGADCVVGLTSGELVRGRLVRFDTDAVVLDLQTPGAEEHRVIDADIATIGRVIGRSKPRRAWIGALVGAVLSLPAALSMPGDAIVVGGLLGSLVGRATGDSRIEIVLRR